jgi:hypothetical protein
MRWARQGERDKRNVYGNLGGRGEGSMSVGKYIVVVHRRVV